jgi:uncharacterized repeat protein (TIGR03803 family)
MTSFGFSRYTLGVALAIAMLAGCGASQPPIGVPGAMQTAAGSAVVLPAAVVQPSGRQVRPDYPESLLYSFGSPGDAAEPESNLIDVGGELYGTTFVGGTGACNLAGGVPSCGTVFAITTAGVESVLYSFTGAPGDGALPSSDLLDVGGTLYGTTQYGGAGSSTECGYHGSGGASNGCGTVFKITPAGVESVLYSFKGVSEGDGSVPVAGLIDVGGTLYGTTALGGNGSGANCGYVSSSGAHSNGCGTVFKITTAGVEAVLYSFKGGALDGAEPSSDLTAVAGKLYGTTVYGGAASFGNGTVFKITTAGVESVLHFFAGFPHDGAQPLLAGMIDVAGKLYGTTTGGGPQNAGTIFKITTAGVETVLHHFGGNNGEDPTASLTYMDGKVYGTTDEGGGLYHGYGTVFQMKLSTDHGQVIHRFSGGSADGEYPRAGVIDVGGTLYGTTDYGGSTAYASFQGYGTVFKIVL